MTIRNRLTLWLGGILLVSLAILAGVVHYEWVEQQRRLQEERKPPEAAWHEVGEIILVYGVPATLLLLGGGWLLVRKSLAPVSALTRAAESIHLDNLRQRLPRAGNGDELDRLTEVFNAMMGRLEDSVGRVREFTLHASHELKTPLSVLRTQIETALREDEITPAQRDLFASQLEEIRRLTKIVNSLAFLAKADAGQAALQLEAVRLDELVQDAFADAQMLAQSRQITVEMPVCEPIAFRGDRHRLRQLLLNLTDNAIKYNCPQGRITIALSRRNGSAELQISNTGPGIAPEKLPRVFDRFYRGDPAHNSDVEGCGLGLSIAEWITKAHGGRIQITSQPQTLTAVTVALPVPPA